MATTSTRRETITFTGDVSSTHLVNAASNTDSPASIEFITLDSGFNSIPVPEGNSTPVSVTIIPPANNSTSITLKGITGDTGLRLHNTDPTTIALHSTTTAIGLTAGAEIAGVRLFWT